MPHCRILWVGALLLFAGGSTIAQQASKLSSPTKSNVGSSAPKADSDLTPPSFLFPFPKGISEPANPRPVTRVEAEVIQAPSNTGLNSYVNNSVLPMIRANWYRLVSRSTENVGGDATVEFTVLRDGSVGANNLAEGAGHAALGDLALSAVRKSEPFPVLPAEITGPFLTVRAHFWYEGTRPSTDPVATGVTANVDGVNEPVYFIGGAVTPPKPVYQPEPEFSEEARRKKVSGSVTLKLIVTSKGEVTDVKVAHSLGSGLDEKAVEAVRQWKFKPATKDGQPVSVQIAVQVDFKIRTKTGQ